MNDPREALMAATTETLERAAFAPTVDPTPFLKWVGGKTRLLSQMEGLLPEEFDGYHEPFVGGGAVFFRLLPDQARLTDVNGRLIDCYTAIRDDVESLADELARHARRHDKAYYYRQRERFNSARRLSGTQRAGLMMYLNKTCFNGLYRENSRGEFNVPMGSYKKPRVLDLPNLLAVHETLKGVDLGVASFERVLDHAEPGDLVYFDPPYVPVSATSSFTSYAKGGFGSDLQVRLAQVFAELAQRGCYVMLSNSDCGLVRELYAGWRIEQVWAPRSINSRADRRGAVPEVVVCSWP